MIKSMTWHQIAVNSSHITVMEVTTVNLTFLICNIYNVPESNTTINELQKHFEQYLPHTPVFFISDFNKHYAL